MKPTNKLLQLKTTCKDPAKLYALTALTSMMRLGYTDYARSIIHFLLPNIQKSPQYQRELKKRVQFLKKDIKTQEILTFYHATQGKDDEGIELVDVPSQYLENLLKEDLKTLEFVCQQLYLSNNINEHTLLGKVRAVEEVLYLIQLFDKETEKVYFQQTGIRARPECSLMSLIKGFKKITDELKDYQQEETQQIQLSKQVIFNKLMNIDAYRDTCIDAQQEYINTKE